jgi:glyceraldehyde-3-phosphate dehydrogenase/erythrose-4-phosphate dehydrogenase
MAVRAPTTNFVGLSVTLTKTQREEEINAPCQFGKDARKLEEWLEIQPQRFVVLRINVDSYNAVVRVMSQFSGPVNN